MRAFFKSKIESLKAGPSCLRASVSLLLCLAAAACATSPPPSSSGRVFTDEIGRVVKVTEHPQRLVSLAPSVTETLFAIGLGDRVVGVTSYCDYPAEAAQKEKVGDTLRPSIEKIVALKPDLVIASTSSQLEQFVRDLDRVGIPVYVSSPRDLEGVMKSIGMIGDITGAGDRAEELIGKMRARINAIQSRIDETKQRPKVLFILGVEPLITIGGASFINKLISRAGGDSISGAVESEYPQFSLETAIASRPEVIFFQAGGEKLPEWLKQTPAAQRGQVFHIDDDLLLRPGPRIVDGLEQMAAHIHPELFAATDK